MTEHQTRFVNSVVDLKDAISRGDRTREDFARSQGRDALLAMNVIEQIEAGAELSKTGISHTSLRGGLDG